MLFKNKNVYLENQVEALTNTLENFYLKFQATIEDQISSMIGIDKWFNTDNQHKDQEIVKTGGANFRKTWALMDSKNILYIDDYPLLFEVLKAEDRGDGTFAMPDFHDGTLRHIRYGDSRELGTFEDDAMQGHTHNNTHAHSSPTHNHTANAITGNFTSPAMEFNEWFASGCLRMDKRETQKRMYFAAITRDGSMCNIVFNATPVIQNSTAIINETTIKTDTGTGKSANETRMKNTAGQWYILAKVTYAS